MLTSPLAVQEQASATPLSRSCGLRVITLWRSISPSVVHRQAPHQGLGRRGLAIEQDVGARRPDDEVEQRLALRGKERGPDRERPADVLRDEALKEAKGILARGRGKANHGAIGKAGGNHGGEGRKRGARRVGGT